MILFVLPVVVIAILLLLIAVLVRTNKSEKKQVHDYREELKRQESSRIKGEGQKLQDVFDAKEDPSLVVTTVGDMEKLAELIEPVLRRRPGRRRKSLTTH